MPPRITLIVATYKRPDALDEVLRGLAQQTRLPDEVLVADDGSGPETRALVERHIQSAPFPVRHVWHPDDGFRLAAIRNRAIEQATGDYLVFLDGDCIPSIHFVADHLRVARPGHWVQGKRILTCREALQSGFGAADVRHPGRLLRRWLRGHINHPHRLLHWPGLPARASQKLRGVRGCNIGAWRADVLKVGGFDERFNGWGLEDSEFVTRLYKLGLRRLDPQFAALCFHLWHPERPRDQLQENTLRLQASRMNDGFETAHGIRPDRASET